MPYFIALSFVVYAAMVAALGERACHDREARRRRKQFRVIEGGRA